MNSTEPVTISVWLPRYYPVSRHKLQETLQQSISGASIEVYPKNPAPSGGGRGGGGAIDLDEAVRQVSVFCSAHSDLLIAGGAYAGKKVIEVLVEVLVDWLKQKSKSSKKSEITICDPDGNIIRRVKVD